MHVHWIKLYGNPHTTSLLRRNCVKSSAPSRIMKCDATLHARSLVTFGVDHSQPRSLGGCHMVMTAWLLPGSSSRVYTTSLIWSKPNFLRIRLPYAALNRLPSSLNCVMLLL